MNLLQIRQYPKNREKSENAKITVYPSIIINSNIKVYRRRLLITNCLVLLGMLHTLCFYFLFFYNLLEESSIWSCYLEP